ncbi:hypothetical protein LguiA_021923 [Lonicera macranthoides]
MVEPTPVGLPLFLISGLSVIAEATGTVEVTGKLLLLLSSPPPPPPPPLFSVGSTSHSIDIPGCPGQSGPVTPARKTLKPVLDEDLSVPAVAVPITLSLKLTPTPPTTTKSNPTGSHSPFSLTKPHLTHFGEALSLSKTSDEDKTFFTAPALSNAKTYLKAA